MGPIPEPMRCRCWLFAALLMAAGPVARARAQDVQLPPVPVTEGPSQVSGTIRDDRGRPIGGAMVVALGSTLFTATTDPAGRFTLPLPAGEYVLRATRDGFVSTYREAIRVPSRATLERNIRLSRAIAAAIAPSAAGRGARPVDPAPGTPNHGHDEAALRLRRLPPTVLRDIGGASGAGEWTAAQFAAARPRFSLLDWARNESRRAVNYFTDVDFAGHVNYLAAGALAGLRGGLPDEGPTRVADLALGAPVGSAGDWTVRGVMDAGRLSSWAIHGEYRSRTERTHAFAVGAAYTMHVPTSAGLTPPATAATGRRVSSGYLLDRWHVQPTLVLDYGLRVDRYDYLSRNALTGARLSVHTGLYGGTSVVASAARHMFAPGSDEFLLPTSAAAWLPPQRTFSTLGQTAFAVERVGRFELGLDHVFGANGARVLSFRRIRESTADQTAVLFGLDRLDDVGHYYVATPGGYDLDGWLLRFDGPIVGTLKGRVAYLSSAAQWRPGPDALTLAPVVSSVPRAGAERSHDLTASLEAGIPGTAAAVLVAYRVNSAYSGAGPRPGVGGRFALQVHYALPCQPIGGSRMEVLFAVRTLYRDVGQPGSAYDELLTVAPPLRLLGGMRVIF